MAEKWIEETFNAQLYGVSVRPHLGEVEARDEWADRDKYMPVFVHTNSYNRFSELDSLFMFGRRGTGKTSIIRMLQYDINSQKSSVFNFCSVVDSDETFTTLSSQLRGSPLVEYPHRDLAIILKNKWKWVIEVAAMRTLVMHQDRIDKEYREEVSQLRKYLEEKNLMSFDEDDPEENHELLQNVADIIFEEMAKIESTVTKVGCAIAQATKRIISTDFKHARRHLYNILKNTRSRCLVVIDSIDAYPHDDRIYQALIAGLIEACLDLSIKSKRQGVLCKAAFPSEMEPYFAPLNSGKSTARSFFIRWNYADLVVMLAKRFRRMYDGNEDPDEYNRLNDKAKALEYLYTILPEKTLSISNIEFDTMAYIIRHTQKKPRQLIHIMNTIVSISLQLKEPDHSISGDAVREGIHAGLGDMLKGTFNIYDQIFERSSEIIRNLLTNKKSHMTMPDLDAHIKDVKNLRKQLSMDTNLLKKLMFAIGCIGRRRSANNFGNNKHEIWLSEFEYQIKNRIAFNLDTHIVIHPMFYTDFSTSFLSHVLIYPTPEEDMELERLKRMGIELV